MRLSDMLIGKIKFIGAVSLGAAMICSGCTRNSGIRYYAAERPAAEAGTVAVTETHAIITPVSDESQTESAAVPVTQALFYIYVVGCVEHPGVYALPEGSRLYEAVELAGGMTDDANAAALNLAEKIYDGEYIRIPSLTMEAEAPFVNAPTVENRSVAFSDSSGVQSKESDTAFININTADSSQLMTLPGIGESKAQAIIAYRETNGPFTSIEDVMKVAGIKESVYEKIRDRITVQ